MKGILFVQKGFTLLEVIIFLVIAAIVGSMLVTHVGTSTKYSVEPVLMLNDRNGLQAGMEEINQEYKRRLAAGSLSLSTFKAEFVDLRPLAVASETRLVSIAQGEDPVLMVTLKSGDQNVYALFSE